MPNGADKRKFKRLQTKWVVKLRRGDASEETIRRTRDDSTIGNISVGGVFIDTPVPFEKGAVIEFDFSLPNQKHPVHVRGLVRWSNRGEIPNMPVGMGIEFLEVTSEDRTRIASYIERESLNQDLSAVTYTPTHKSLLLLYDRKIGQTFSLEVLTQFIRCKNQELMDALRDFSRLRLIDMKDDQVTFRRAPDETLAARIVAWCEDARKNAPPPRGKA
jgi:uncharacterized protein (TIGR02266 family)